jgi:hypothetical protein
MRVIALRRGASQADQVIRLDGARNEATEATEATIGHGPQSWYGPGANELARTREMLTENPRRQ